MVIRNFSSFFILMLLFNIQVYSSVTVQSNYSVINDQGHIFVSNTGGSSKFISVTDVIELSREKDGAYCGNMEIKVDYVLLRPNETKDFSVIDGGDFNLARNKGCTKINSTSPKVTEHKTTLCDTLGICAGLYSVDKTSKNYQKLDSSFSDWSNTKSAVIIKGNLYVLAANIWKVNLEDSNQASNLTASSLNGWGACRHLFTYESQGSKRLGVVCDKIYDIDIKTGEYHDLGLGTGWSTTKRATSNGRYLFTIQDSGGFWRIDLQSKDVTQIASSWQTSKSLIWVGPQDSGYLLSFHDSIYKIDKNGSYSTLGHLGTGWGGVLVSAVDENGEVHVVTSTGTYFVIDAGITSYQTLLTGWGTIKALVGTFSGQMFKLSKSLN